MSDNLPIARRDHWRAFETTRVIFGGGPDRDHRRPLPWVPYIVPRDTMSPRYVACTDHHVACDCREAILSENERELRFELRDWTDAANDVLAGHPTRIWLPGVDEPAGCACTGCEITRRAHHYPTRAHEPWVGW